MLTFPGAQGRTERIFIHCWASSNSDSHGKESEEISGIIIHIWIRGRIAEIRLDILLHLAINSGFSGKANNRSRSFYLGASFDVSQANCCLAIHLGDWERGNRAKIAAMIQWELFGVPFFLCRYLDLFVSAAFSLNGPYTYMVCFRNAVYRHALGFSKLGSI